MDEWGLFNDEAADYSRGESVECEFYTRDEAERARYERYSVEDGLEVHMIEEPDEDEDEED